MKRNKLIVGIGLLLIGVFALYGFANAQEQYVFVGEITNVPMSIDPLTKSKIAVAQDGTVYVTDGINGVHKIDGNGIVTEDWLSGLNKPQGIALDPSGNIYVAVTEARNIQKYNITPSLIDETGYCSGQKPFDITVYAADPDVHFYVADRSNQYIRKGNAITLDCPGTYWGGYTPTGEEGKFLNPEGVAVDSEGNVYVADTYNHRIQKFNGDGDFITKWGSEGSGDGEFEYPSGIAVDSEDNVYVADTGRVLTGESNHRIQKFDGDGNFITKWGSEGIGDSEFSYPSAIAVSSDGIVYVADAGNIRIQMFSRDPIYLLQELIEKVLFFNLKQGIENSMEAKLENAIDAVDAANADQRQDAVNKLEAFKNAVEAQRDKELTSPQADELIADADAIIALLQL